MRAELKLFLPLHAHVLLLQNRELCEKYKSFKPKWHEVIQCFTGITQFTDNNKHPDRWEDLIGLSKNQWIIYESNVVCDFLFGAFFPQNKYVYSERC